MGLRTKMTADSKQSLNASMEPARQRELVTFDCDVELQPALTRNPEVFSFASSGLVETATQDSKIVFRLNKLLGDETETFAPFTERRYNGKRLSS